MKKLLLTLIIGIVWGILTPGNSPGANFTVCDDPACFTGALLVNPAPVTQDFEGFNVGTNMNGVEFMNRVYATSPFANLEVFSGTGIGKVLFGFDDTTRQNGNGYYEIHLNDDNYKAIGFNVKGWDPSATGPATVEVDFSDGSTAKLVRYQTSGSEYLPVFFGIISDSYIPRIRWYESLEVGGTGNEEVGLDDFVAGGASQSPSCGLQGGTAILPVSTDPVTVSPLPGVTLTFDSVTEPNTVTAMLADPEKKSKVFIDPKTSKGWRIYEDTYYSIKLKKSQEGFAILALNYKISKVADLMKKSKIAHLDDSGKLIEILDSPLPVDVVSKKVYGTWDMKINSIFAIVEPVSYAFTTVDYPGAEWTLAWGINDNEQIVGHYTDVTGASHGFLKDNSTFTAIDYPGARDTFLKGINNNGQIAGYSSYVSFVKDGSTFTPVDYPEALETAAFGINNSGQIVGYYMAQTTMDHGFLKNDAGFSSIDYPGALETDAFGINNKGQIVGRYFDGTHGFLKDGLTFSAIDCPGAFGTEAYGINDSGLIAGTYYSGIEHGFITDTVNFLTIDYPGALGTIATGINNKGQIVGFWRDANGGTHGFLATPEEDTTPPTISFKGTCPITVNLNASASITVLVTDDLSGVAYQSKPNGPNILDTAAVGTKTFTVTAQDNAKNEASNSCTYRVIYDFTGAGGFQSPINNPPVLNTAKAGSAVPVKWQLPDGHGGFISTLGAITSITFQKINCANVSSTLTDPVETTATGNTGLRSTANQYIYNWQTSKSWAGSCYVLNLSLNDGSKYSANFQLK